ncbi:MAG TPA: Gfo/Idh/MocA family oxidoreductase [bacterium]|nr:Gfo/Idh/MocA family oxidoreductase [bacterium]
MSKRIYRAGIIGCGRKAATLDDEERCRTNYSIAPDAHAAAYKQIPEVALAAAADPNASKRDLMRERWGVPAVYKDYREMLTREDLDLVSVTTRAPLHAEVTIAAAKAGVRGILCEKAMATSLREADAMIEACKRARTKLLINHTRRWHPTYARATETVRAGAIGALRCIVGVCPGPLIHNGTHLFDLMRLFGGDVKWVCGEVQPGGAQDAPGRAMLAFQNGAAGFVDLDSSVGLALELQCTTGRILIDSSEDGFAIWEYQDPPRSSGLAWYQGNACKPRSIRHVDSGGGVGTLVAAITELITCVEEDHEGRSSGQDGRAALELALAVYQSHAHGGMRVTLPLQDRALTVPSR